MDAFTLRILAQAPIYRGCRLACTHNRAASSAVPQNAAHGSDSPESAAREIEIMFRAPAEPAEEEE